MNEIKNICIFNANPTYFELSSKFVQAGFKVFLYYRNKKKSEIDKQSFISQLDQLDLKDKEMILEKTEFTSHFLYICENSDIILDTSGDLGSSPNAIMSLDYISKPETIFILDLSNKSFLKKLSIAERQDKIIGININYPIDMRNKIKIIKRRKTSNQTVKVIADLIKKIGKKPKIIKREAYYFSISNFIFSILAVKNILTDKSNNQINIKKNLSNAFNFYKNYFYQKVYKKIQLILANISQNAYYSKIWLIKLINKKKDKYDLRVNIGGGPFFKKHWRILDLRSIWYSYPSVYIDYEFDLTSNKPLPFKDNSVKFFYTSHTFEHIPKEYCEFIFKEICRCLHPGGAIRLTMPDFDKAYDAYKNNDHKFFEERAQSGTNRKEIFITLFLASALNFSVHEEEFDKNFKTMKKEEFADYYTPPISKRLQNKMPGAHINWWNFDKLKRLLTNAGFKEIYRSAPNQSRFPEMRNQKGKKYFDTTRVPESIFVEAVK